jgi:hypothetical protein
MQLNGITVVRKIRLLLVRVRGVVSGIPFFRNAEKWTTVLGQGLDGRHCTYISDLLYAI